MLAALLIWAYSLMIFYIYGYGGLIFLKKISKFQDGLWLSFPIIVILGIAIITTIASYLSLITPLASTAAILILLGGILIAIFTRPWKKLSLPTYHPLVWVLLAVVTIVVLENATHRPTNYDTALYHAQAIHWIESYRAVPGLVNINDHLAYNSSWLVLVASMSFAFLGLRSFHLTNSVILLATMFYFGESFQALLQKQFTASNFVKVVLFFLSLYLYTPELSSPGTDLPPTLLIWIITILILEKVEKRDLNFDLYSSFIFVFSVFNVVIKLSSLPLCLPALLILIQQAWNKSWQRSMILTGIALVILSAWFLRNMVISGYLIFPISQIDLFSFDWKYPLASTATSQQILFWYDKFPVSGWTKYVGATWEQWLPIWFHQLDRGQKVLLLISIASPIGLLAYRFSKTEQNLAIGFSIIFILNYAGVFFWILTSPLFRFGYAYLFGSIILGSASAILRLVNLIKKGSLIIFLPLVIFAFILPLYILATTTDLSTISKDRK